RCPAQRAVCALLPNAPRASLPCPARATSAPLAACVLCPAALRALPLLLPPTAAACSRPRCCRQRLPPMHAATVAAAPTSATAPAVSATAVAVATSALAPILLTAAPVMATITILAIDADGRPFALKLWLAGLRRYLRRFTRDGASLFEHTSGSLQPPMPPTEPAADAGEHVQRQYRAARVACMRWTERDGVALLAVRSHLPVDQRAHFFSNSGDGGSGGGQQRQQRQPKTLSSQQPRECVSQCRVLGGVEATSLGAREPASTGAAPTEALHTFTLDSGATRCFFRDCTTVTPLTTLVPITLADPSGGTVVARASIVLPCPAVLSGSLTGFHLPSFAKNLVSTAVLQDQFVTVTTPGGELVAICMDSRTGAHLATFTRRPESGLYTLTTESAHVAASDQVAASCSCRLLTHLSLL
ncbi:unnamed protein product, partial [Closterium sp. NIES-54]